MKSPLEIIQEFGIPTHSIIHAIREFRENGTSLSKEEYEKGIMDIIGGDHPPSFDSTKEAELYFLYTVQETIRAFLNSSVPDMEQVWFDADRRAATFIKDNPWCVKEYGTDESEGTVTTHKRKGQKKDQAERLYRDMNNGENHRQDIIGAFIEQLDMSKAGATTYFHNLKKKFGYKAPKEDKVTTAKDGSVTVIKRPSSKGRGQSKGAIAKTIYAEMKGQSKETIIATIIQKTGTSKAGANTYFCAARKELG